MPVAGGSAAPPLPAFMVCPLRATPEEGRGAGAAAAAAAPWPDAPPLPAADAVAVAAMGETDKPPASPLADPLLNALRRRLLEDVLALAAARGRAVNMEGEGTLASALCASPFTVASPTMQAARL